MKRITLLAGQNSENYGEKLTYFQALEVLKDKDVKIYIPTSVKESLHAVFSSDAVIFAGRRMLGNIDSLDIVTMALEMERPVFFFGVGLGEMRNKGLRKFSTILMSPLTQGFLTDHISTRWAQLWAGKRVRVGADLCHIYLLTHAKRGKSKFAVFSPRYNGVLRRYKELKWLPALDARIVVANHSDSKAAIDVSQHLKTEDIIIVSEPKDVMEVVSNAKFIISERFHVSLTAESFGVPFIHVGRRAMRYFEKDFEDNFSLPDEVEMALAFSKIKENVPDHYERFNERIKKRFEEMLKGLNSFLMKI